MNAIGGQHLHVTVIYKAYAIQVNHSGRGFGVSWKCFEGFGVFGVLGRFLVSFGVFKRLLKFLRLFQRFQGFKDASYW